MQHGLLEMFQYLKFVVPEQCSNDISLSDQIFQIHLLEEIKLQTVISHYKLLVLDILYCLEKSVRTSLTEKSSEEGDHVHMKNVANQVQDMPS